MGIFKIKRFTKDSSEEKKIDEDNEKLSTKDKWIKRGTYAGGVAAGALGVAAPMALYYHRKNKMNKKERD